VGIDEKQGGGRGKMTKESIIGLIVTIVFILYLVIQIIASYRKKNPIHPISYILVAVGLFIALLSVYRGKELTAGDLAQTILTIGILTITAVYAWSTEKMSRANEKMAEEMQNQRYDMARPVIDIEVKPVSNLELAKQAYTEIGKLKLPKNFSCKICNIGFGPAIDTYITTLLDDNKPARNKLGVIKVNDELRNISLSFEERDENKLLIVYYRDIYGRSFESTREIIMSLQYKSYTFGILNTNRTKEDKNSND
jgi:hypothetical protein